MARSLCGLCVSDLLSSLRGAKRRSNPDWYRGKTLNCFASLAMTKEKKRKKANFVGWAKARKRHARAARSQKLRCTAWAALRLAHPTKKSGPKKKKEAERRQTQCLMSPCQRARLRATKMPARADPPLRARSPVGVPLTASSWRCRNISVQLQARHPGTRPLRLVR